MSVYQAAKDYVALGYSVIGCRDKMPVASVWTTYQETPPTDIELDLMFVRRSAPEVAVICGPVSGGLEVIDIDIRDNNDLTDQVWNAVVDFFNDIKQTIYAVSTRNKGIHIYYRTDEPAGNKKLAKRDGKWIIETRGQGGYVIAPPSPGYDVMTGHIAEIPYVSAEDRETLWSIVQSFHQVDEADEADKPERIRLPSGTSSMYKTTPWDHYNSTPAWMTILLDAGWEKTHETPDRIFFRRPGSDNKFSANYHKDKNVFWTFSPNSPLPAEKPLSPFDIFLHYKHGGDVAAAMNALRADNYGELYNEHELAVIQEANSKMAEGFADEDIRKLVEAALIARAVRHDPTTVHKIITSAKREAVLPFPRFWVKRKSGDFKVQPFKFAEFLTHLGFRCFVQEPLALAFRLIRFDFDRRIAAEYALDMVKKSVIEYLAGLNLDSRQFSLTAISELIADIPDSRWTATFDLLPRVGTFNTTFLRDTEDRAYFLFRNAFIQVTAAGADKIDFQDIPENTYVWATNIIDDEIELAHFDADSDLNRSIFHKYVKRIAGITPDLDDVTPEELMETYPAKYELFSAFVSTIGYLMHTYKAPNKPYAIIFCEDTPADGDGGGTGKSIMYKCLALMRCIDRLSGQEWSPDGSFPYQSVRLGCNVLVLDDLPQMFKPGKIYNLVTEGMTIEKKFKDVLTLDYQDSPKILLITNYDIYLAGNHAKRRFRKVPFVPYFGDGHTPFDEFGQMLGQGWSREQQQLFYNAVFIYVATYLRYGMVELDDMTTNMKIKSVSEMAGEEFYDWFSAMLPSLEGTLEGGGEVWTPRADLFAAFIEETANKRYSMRRFVRAMEYHCELFGKKLVTRRNWSSNNVGRYEVRVSDGPDDRA